MPSSRASSDLVVVRRHLGLGAAVENRHVVRAEPQRLAGDVDRRVAPADHDHVAADLRRLSGLDRLDEWEGLPDAPELVARVRNLCVRPQADSEEDGIRVLGGRLELFAAVDSRTEPKLDAELLQRARLVRKRVAHLAIGGDCIADEPAELLALVEDGHRNASCGKLSCTGEAGRAGADDDDPSAGGPSARPEG